MFAYIDEAGQRSRSLAASDHFVMSAVVIADERLPVADVGFPPNARCRSGRDRQK